MSDVDDTHYVHVYPNRTLCDVLHEARQVTKQVQCLQQRRLLMSLIEEMQTLGNRMEAGLSDKKDLVRLSEAKSKMGKEYKELRAKLKKLKQDTKDK